MKINFTFNFLLVCLIALVLGACSSTKVYTSANSQEIVQNGIIQQPKIAYLTVDAKHKITGKSSIKAKTTSCPSIDDMKEQAEYDALKTNGFDVIIEPIFKVTVIDHWKTREISVEVEGFPGKYTDFKDMKDISVEDREALKLYGYIIRNGAGQSTTLQTSSGGPVNMLKMMLGGKKK
jgi:hypothetical protein